MNNSHWSSSSHIRRYKYINTGIHTLGPTCISVYKRLRNAYVSDEWSPKALQHLFDSPSKWQYRQKAILVFFNFPTRLSISDSNGRDKVALTWQQAVYVTSVIDEEAAYKNQRRFETLLTDNHPLTSRKWASIIFIFDSQLNYLLCSSRLLDSLEGYTARSNHRLKYKANHRKE